MSAREADAKRIFLDAVENHTPDQWAGLLQAACGDDYGLCVRVEALLHAHAASHPLFDAGPSADTLDVPPGSTSPHPQIGRYKLLQEIGEGGMGVVYMAEQREPVRRRVALKIIKPGMDTRAVVARFEAERQALAMMDHPNIAHVLDGGATESGRPYFVMELVNGVRITHYCDQNQLTTRQRLELFVPVCHAVQHAHQKGIIHRDLKPSNVLVTLHDGVPVPRIIDFGIAKAVHQQLTDKTVFTGHGEMIGTPLYMSPEQAEISGLDVDTRSDIYSLGVLLYELLTGTTPFSKDELREAGIDEIRRMIREEEPLQPSARISTLGATATAVSTHRKTDPAKLGKLLRRDLDWIVMKALQKDRTRRYQTASDFARDVQRYLADEPIEARPPTISHRAARWARRHRPAVWAGVASLLVAVAALAISTALIVGAYQREREQRAQAEAATVRERETAEHEKQQRAAAAAASARAQENAAQAVKNYETARQAVRQMLTRVADEQLAKIPEMKEVRRRLLEDAAAFYTELLKLNPRDPRAYYERGGVYRLLRKYDKVGADYEKAVELDADNAEFHRTLGEFLLRCPDVAFRNEDRALVHIKWAIRLDPLEPLQHEWLGSAYAKLGKAQEARGEYQRAAALVPGTGLAHLLLSLECGLANDQEGRLIHLQKAIELEPTAVVHHLHLALVYQNLGRYEDAIAAATTAIAIAKKDQGVYETHAYSFYLPRAEAYSALKMYPDALADCDESLKLAPFRSCTYKRRAVVHFHLKNYGKALADIAKAVELKPDDTSNVRWIPIGLAAKCPDEGFRQGLVGLIDKTIEKVGDQGELYEFRAILLATLGARQEALAALAKARELNPAFAWLEGPIAELYVHYYGLVAPDDRRLGEAVNDLRERVQANDALSPPLIHWASQWVPAAMRGTDNQPAIVFVSDLPWVRSTCGWGPSAAVRDGTPWGGPILIDRLPYAHGIHTHAFEDARPADVVLDVTGQKFSAFKAQVGLPDAKGSVQYQVLVDGNIRGETSVLRAGMLCSIAADVVGAKEIVLRVLNGGDGNASDSAAWGFARLLRADAMDPLEEPPAELRSATEANAAFFLAEVHWRLDQKELARRWYDKAAAWMDKNKSEDAKLRDYRDEAAKLLGIGEKPSTEKEQPRRPD